MEAVGMMPVMDMHFLLVWIMEESNASVPQGLEVMVSKIVKDLKHNSLSGPIPWQLSGMVMMEILDLSHNKLTGEIPQSLTELSFLSAFDTFPPTSLEGNKGLYSRSFSGFMPSPSDETPAQHHHQKLQIGFPFWFGALAGFLITIATCFASGWVFS